MLRRLGILAFTGSLLIGVACGEQNAVVPASNTNITAGTASQSGLITGSSSTTTMPVEPATDSPSTTTTTWITTATRPTTPTTQPSLSSNDYYTNVDGNMVHSPAYSSGGAPAGATAQCRDGTYSFSQHRSGTCSAHGGVASWL